MSDKCGNCDCADSSQCVKKGNQYGLDIGETEMIYDAMVMDATENNGNCKCGPTCACINCTCGSH